jgi:hypothetical protein
MTRLDREREAAVATRSSLHLLRALQRMGFSRTGAPCPYRHHRPTDWRRTDRDDAIPVCGVCHPPAPGIPTETYD